MKSGIREQNSGATNGYMKERHFGVVVLALALIFTTQTAFGQGVTGRLMGTVVDATKSSVPNAHVKVTNQNTKMEFKFVTNQDGNFLAPYLPPGTYEVQVEAPGFRPAVFSGNAVRVDDTTRVDITLAVAGVASQVEVSGVTPVVESTTSDLGQVMEEKQIQNLPLNGRIYTQLVTQLPGAISDGWSSAPEAAAGAGARTPISADVNGLGWSGTIFTLDGLYNMEPLNGFANVTPPIDALEEVSIKTSNAGADVGNFGGAQVNASIKSGTNEFHGFMFEYLRNQALDAQLYNFTSSPIPKAPFKSNQFGGGLGGPIIKNKLFFFADYQGLRLINGYQDIDSVPTALERQGIFSSSEGFSTIYDPLSAGRTPFLNNTIPQDRFDPVVQKILAQNSSNNMGTAFWPMPNVTFPSCTEGQCLFANYTGVHSEPQNVNQFDVKIDYQIGPKDRVFVRESYVHSNLSVPDIGGAPFFAKSDVNSIPRDHSAAIGYFHTFTTNLSNELRLGFGRFNVVDHNNSFGSNENSLLGIPNAVIAGHPETTDVVNIFFSNQLQSTGGPGWTDSQRLANTYQMVDSVTWIHGEHTFSFGGDIELVQSTLTNMDYPGSGFMGFSQCYTANADCTSRGDPWASFLLGADYTYGREFLNSVPGLSMWWPSLFAKDDYKVTKRLTLNLGLRWNEFTRPVERKNREANFNLTDGLLYVATPSNRTAFVNNFSGFAPRVGLAYALGDKTAIRAGAGITYWNDVFGATGGFLERNFPFFQAETEYDYTGTNIPQYYMSVNGLPAYVTVPITPTIDLSQENTIVDTGHMNKNYKPDTAYTWNFGIQRQLTGTSVLDVSYVGTQGRHLFNRWDANIPVPGMAGNPEANRPYGTLVPGQPDLYIDEATSDGWSSYNSLQIKYTKRVSQGLEALVSYTWQKSMDDAYVVDPYNPIHNRGLSTGDHAHVLNASYMYELPFGRGRKWLGNASRPVDLIVGGWMMSGITAIRDGDPLVFTFNCGDLGIMNDPLNTECSTPYSERVSLSCKQLTKVGKPNAWFDPNGCFAIPAPLTFGNVPVGYMRGPGLVNFDMSFSKSEHIREKMDLKFTADFFNIFNTPHFGDPNTNYDPTQPSAAAYGFGQITSLNSTATEREIQLGLKLTF